jgi:hypothetical protein
MAFLPTEALCFRNCDSLDAHLLEGLLHFIEFERLDDRLDFFHFEPVTLRGRQLNPRPGPRKSNIVPAKEAIVHKLWAEALSLAAHGAL